MKRETRKCLALFLFFAIFFFFIALLIGGCNKKTETEATIEEIDCSFDVLKERAGEFKTTLKKLSIEYGIEIRMIGEPYEETREETTEKGKIKVTYVIFDFVAKGDSAKMEEMLNKLSIIFENPYDDRD